MNKKTSPMSLKVNVTQVHPTFFKEDFDFTSDNSFIRFFYDILLSLSVFYFA